MSERVAETEALQRDPTAFLHILVTLRDIYRYQVSILALVRYWLMSWFRYPDWAPQWSSRRKRTAQDKLFESIISGGFTTAGTVNRLKQEVVGLDFAAWRNRKGEGLLHLAVWANRPDLVSVLLQEGCDMEAHSPFRLSPFLCACVWSNLAVVKAFLSARPEYPAGPQLTPTWGPTPLEVVRYRDDRNAYLYLLQKGAQATPRMLRRAILREDTETVRLMTGGPCWLKGQGGGLLATFTNTYWLTPLQHALDMRKDEVACVLARDMTLMTSKQRWAIVHLLVKGRRHRVLKAVQAAGWRCDDTKEGSKALIQAVEASDYNITVALLSSGVEVGRGLVKMGWMRRGTILHFACCKADVQVVAALLAFGADLNTPDSKGRTVLSEALDNAKIDPLIRYHIAALNGQTSVLMGVTKQGPAWTAYKEFAQKKLAPLIAQAASQGRRSPNLTPHEASLTEKPRSTKNAATAESSQVPMPQQITAPDPPAVPSTESQESKTVIAPSRAPQPPPVSPPKPQPVVAPPQPPPVTAAPVIPTRETAPVIDRPMPVKDARAKEPTPNTVPEKSEEEVERERVQKERADKRKARKEREKANKEKARKEAEAQKLLQQKAELERLDRQRKDEERKREAEALLAQQAEEEEEMEEPEVIIDPKFAHLYCPLSQEMMTDAVIACDGITYQRSALKAFIDKCYQEDKPYTSPVSGGRIDIIIREDRAVRSQALQYESALLLEEVA